MQQFLAVWCSFSPLGMVCAAPRRLGKAAAMGKIHFSSLENWLLELNPSLKCFPCSCAFFHAHHLPGRRKHSPWFRQHLSLPWSFLVWVHHRDYPFCTLFLPNRALGQDVSVHCDSQTFPSWEGPHWSLITWSTSCGFCWAGCPGAWHNKVHMISGISQTNNLIWPDTLPRYGNFVVLDFPPHHLLFFKRIIDNKVGCKSLH